MTKKTKQVLFFALIFSSPHAENEPISFFSMFFQKFFTTQNKYHKKLLDWVEYNISFWSPNNFDSNYFKIFPKNLSSVENNRFGILILFPRYISYHKWSSDWVECDIWFLSLLIWDSNVFETYPTKFLKVERNRLDGTESSFIFEWVSRLSLAFSSSIWAMKICFRSFKVGFWSS